MLGYKRASAKIYLSRITRFSQFAGTHCGPIPIHVVDSYLGTFSTDPPRIGPCWRWGTHGEWLRSGSFRFK